MGYEYEVDKEEAARQDKERLDWLQQQTTGYGLGWIFRMSIRGYGCRLHETGQVGAHPDVRQAIDRGMHHGMEEVEDGD